MEVEEPEQDIKEEDDQEREQRAIQLKAEGNKKYSSKQYKDAIDLYSEAIDAFARPEFYGNRAASYIAIGDFKKALADCHSAIELDPKFRKAYIRGTKCYTEMADFALAQQFAKNGLDLFPNDQELKRAYDRVDIIQNKLNRIENKLNTISRKYNSFFECHLTTNSNIASNQDSDDKEEKTETEAQKITHKLSKEDEKEIDLAISMINSLLANDLSRSIELKSTNIRALIIKQNYDSALSNATNLLRWNKDNGKVTELRAIALLRNGNTDSAIKHLQQILRKDPDNKNIKQLFKHFKKISRSKDAANKAFKASDLEQAQTKYTQCLNLDPTNLKFNCIIYSNRAAVFLRQKQWQKAYEDASTAIDLDNSYIKAYGRRIQALYMLDRYNEAVADAEKALALDPTSNDLKQQVREAQIELKKSKRKNYYKILGVEKDATEKEIKKGFRKMAMKWHPDKFASETEEERKSAEEKFKEIGEAYEVLKDPKMKQRYDSGVDPDQLKSGGFPGFHGGGVDISHIFDLLGGMGGGGGNPGFQHFSSGGGHPHSHGGQGGQNFTFRFG